MENNIEDALMAGGLLGLIITPFLVIAHLSKKKIKLSMTARLVAVAHQSNFLISRSEQFDTKAIGLDEAGKTIVFIDTNNNKDLFIDLAEITVCKLLKKMDADAVGSIALQLVNEKGTLLYTVPFYRRFIDDETSLSISLKTAEKWSYLIQKLVRNQRKPASSKLSRGLTPPNQLFETINTIKSKIWNRLVQRTSSYAK